MFMDPHFKDNQKVFHLHIYLHLKVPCIPVLHNVLDMLLVNHLWIWSLQQSLLLVEHLVGHSLSGHRIWLEYRVEDIEYG